MTNTITFNKFIENWLCSVAPKPDIAMKMFHIYKEHIHHLILHNTFKVLIPINK